MRLIARKKTDPTTCSLPASSDAMTICDKDIPAKCCEVNLHEELLRGWDSQMPPDPLLDSIRHLLEDRS